MRRTLTHKQQDEIVSRWVGTPYGHRMAAPGRGVDSVHLAATILSELGIEIGIPGYQQFWRINDPGFFELQLESMRERWIEIKRASIRFSDIALMIGGQGFIQHAAAIVDAASILHILDDWLPQVRLDPISRFEKYIK